MKLRSIVLSVAVLGLMFTACNDTTRKEKEAEESARMEQMDMEDARLRAEEEAEMAQMEFDNNTIAVLTTEEEKYSTFASSIQTAELDEVFKGEGEYTVFVPTNEAFNKVPKTTMDNYNKPENKEQFQNLLKYHVISGEWKTEDLTKAINDNNNTYNVTTLQGENLVLSLKDGRIMVKDSKGGMATVTTSDIDASNGVIHIIDKVIMPKK